MIERMRQLVLNGADWTTKDDVYDAFFRAVGAPEWHGRNPPLYPTLCLYHHSQFHLLDFDVVGERKEAAQG